MRLTLAEIAQATGGTAVGDPSTEVDSVSIDSRTMSAGGLFVAVRGERDGHEFVADARAHGAAAVLVERPATDRRGDRRAGRVGAPLADRLADSDGVVAEHVWPATDLAAVIVDDTVEALARLGSHARDRLAPGARVVGITGSTGKTSTKDLTAAVLAARWEVCASPASFNNELGVPLTLLAAGPTTGAVVAEMGARGHGHVEALARVVRPTIGIVTHVGMAHTETFGSVDEVAVAKSELLAALPAGGTAVVGTGHPHVDTLRAASGAPVVTVGRDSDDDVRVSDVRVDHELRPTFVLSSPWGRRTVRLEMRGAHQAVNAAMAVAAGAAAGVDLDAAVAQVAMATGSRWRMEVGRAPSGVIVINDAYNANPTSVAAALDALGSLDVDGRRWAVLGEMAELGAASDAAHRRVGEMTAERSIDRVVVVGDGAAAIATAARAAGVDVHQVADADEALAALSGVRAGDAVLVKASRVAGLEHVAHALLGAEPTDRGAAG